MEAVQELNVSKEKSAVKKTTSTKKPSIVPKANGIELVGEDAEAPIDTVKPNDWNTNTMTTHMKGSVRHGLKNDGWIRSQRILVWRTDEKGNVKNIIIDGEHRWVEAKASGYAGLVPVTYLDGLRLPMRVFRVTASTTLLALNLVRTIAYIASGVFVLQDLTLVLAAIVPAALGTLAGDRLHDRMNPQAFRRVVGAVLIASGGALLLR